MNTVHFSICLFLTQHTTALWHVFQTWCSRNAAPLQNEHRLPLTHLWQSSWVSLCLVKQLKNLDFEELQMRLSALDPMMEREIEELRQRYTAKRQPILDAMDAKKRRQQNFWALLLVVVVLWRLWGTPRTSSKGCCCSHKHPGPETLREFLLKGRSAPSCCSSCSVSRQRKKKWSFLSSDTLLTMYRKPRVWKDLQQKAVEVCPWPKTIAIMWMKLRMP